MRLDNTGGRVVGQQRTEEPRRHTSRRRVVVCLQLLICCQNDNRLCTSALMPRRQPGCTHTKSPYFAASPNNESRLRETQEEAELARLCQLVAAEGLELSQARKVVIQAVAVSHAACVDTSHFPLHLSAGLVREDPSTLLRKISRALRHGALYLTQREETFLGLGCCLSLT